MSGVPRKSSLCFGVPSLDDLFGTFSLSHRAYGIPVEGEAQTKVTLIGPEGSGKSILALHLASRYVADSVSRGKAAQLSSRPVVIYISTDLTFDKAHSTWKSFRLDRPNLREVPFYHGSVPSSDTVPVDASDVALNVELKALDVLDESKPNSLANHVLNEDSPDKPREASVGFVDLIKYPVGDLWSFTSRLLASLEAQISADRHLVIIDDVDGFEVLMGELNAYGDRSSVRARIMQTVQEAARKGHLVFVSEEHGPGARPLADVSDIVVRLSIHKELNYKYRAIEIEKARAQAVHRGHHYFMVRTGGGSTTGTQENPDDPRVANAYILVVPSLSTVSRRNMNEPATLEAVRHQGLEHRAGFGLAGLDELCGAGSHHQSEFCVDVEGLKYGTLNAILGDSNTHKSELSHSFIHRGFELFAENLHECYHNWEGSVFDGGSKLGKVVATIANAVSGSQDSQPPMGNESPRWTRRKILNGLEQADVKAQLAFLSTVLLHSRSGAEEAWTPAQVEAEIASITDSGVPGPGLVLLYGRWAVRVLSRTLKGFLITKPEEWLCSRLTSAVLPPQLASEGIVRKLCNGESINIQELFHTMADLLWKRSGEVRDPRRLEWLSKYMDRRVSRVAIAREVIKARKEIFIDPGAEAGKEELRKHWSKSILTFIEECFPGGLDYLSAGQVEELMNAGPQFELDSSLLTKIFVGFAMNEIRSYTQEETALKAWLSRLKLLPGLNFATEEANPSSLNVDSFLVRIVDFIDDYATPGDRAMFAGCRPNSMPTRSGESLEQFLLSVTPGLVSKREIDRCRFADWLLGVSPYTHPYALDSGRDALSNELTLVEPSSHTPVFCSAMVALVLHAVRLGRLTMRVDKHLDQELRARRLATETLSDLKTWLAEFINDSGTMALEIEKFVDASLPPSNGQWVPTSGELTAFVRAFSKPCGLYLELAEEAELGFAAQTKLQVCRLVLEAAARQGLLDGPAVLVTTQDTRVELFLNRYDGWLTAFLDRHQYDEETALQFRNMAQEHMRQWLIVRRLEVHYLATATLAAIVRRCVTASQSVLFAEPARARPTPLDDRVALTDGTLDPPIELSRAQIPQTGALSQEWLVKIERRRQLSWNIRLVIDGLTGIRHTYPNVVSDPLFLPSLKFYIGWENLTSLVVVSQAGRPDQGGADTFERNTVDLFLTQIRTWRVRFFGELRVAVALLPPPADLSSARIREICLRPGGKIAIDPHFELYKGLETDRPERVPLEVRLVGGTEALRSYSKVLNEVFTDMFPAPFRVVPSSEVVLTDTSGAWAEKLRDFGRLHRESRLDHTLLLQVDEYWAFQRSVALRRQAKYLNAHARDNRGAHDNDPLEVFQPTLADADGLSRPRRAQGFVWNGYQRVPARAGFVSSERSCVDRIPFLWDFGFLLCKRTAWNDAMHQELHIAQQSYVLPGRQAQTLTVGQVWTDLPKISPQDQFKIPTSKDQQPDRTTSEGTALLNTMPLRSWRLFMEAAVATSSHRTLSTVGLSPALDLALQGGESLACLILEIWASEVYRKFELDAAWSKKLQPSYFDRFVRRSWAPSRTRGLIGLISEPESKGSLRQIYGKALAQGRLPRLARHSLDLFKSLLLLREGLDLGSFIDSAEPFRLKMRPANPAAICARHWYGTACDFIDANPSAADDFVPVRLPGNFSVRGDWYLAVASGSQSSLLADRALDLLSSRRGNFERLRRGIGLPVRDIADPETGADPRTRLTTVSPDGTKDWIRYREIRDLGADKVNQEYTDPSKAFHWLWRSALGDYDAQSRAFQQGVIHLVNWWISLRNSRGTSWQSGFDLFDALERYRTLNDDSDPGSTIRNKIFDTYFAVHSLWDFAEICDDVIDRLRRATPRRSDSARQVEQA